MDNGATPQRHYPHSTYQTSPRSAKLIVSPPATMIQNADFDETQSSFELYG